MGVDTEYRHHTRIHCKFMVGDVVRLSEVIKRYGFTDFAVDFEWLVIEDYQGEIQHTGDTIITIHHNGDESILKLLPETLRAVK